MVVEPQQPPILLVVMVELLVFCRQHRPELRTFQLLCDPGSLLREAPLRILRQAFQIPGDSGFLAEIVVQIPKLLCQKFSLIPFRFCQFNVGGKLPSFQKLSNPLCGNNPGNHLGRPVIPGRFSMRQPDALLVVPDIHTANAIAPVVELLQIGSNFAGGFLFFKGSYNPLPLPVGIAAQTQDVINLFLGKRESGECRFRTLRFRNGFNLFRLCGEEGKLRFHQRRRFFCQA